MSSMQGDEAAVLAEIAQLERAINQHKAAPSYRGRGAASYGYAPRGRGGGARGRGRGGGATTPSYKNATWVAPGLQAAATTSGGDTTPTTTAAPSAFASASATPLSYPNSRSATPSSSRINGPTPSTSTLVAAAASPDAPPPPTREVTIDGVVFVADPRGNKLVRKQSHGGTSGATATASAATTATTTTPTDAAPPLTPRRLSHLGTTYIRTKTGNLVSLAFARKQKDLADAKRRQREEMQNKRERLDKLVGVVKSVQGARNEQAAAGTRGGRGGYSKTSRRRPPKPKSDKLCRFFQRTGQCSRAHTCPYVHDSTTIAICPLFLRSSCPRSASLCPLSHSPNAHRSPHCVHFPNCTRGAACPYAHVKVSGEAVPCRDFVELGWCDRGEECEKRHVRECWRFAETGKCEKVGCREPHVLRRTHTASEDEQDDDDAASAGGDEDDAVDELIEDAVERTEAERVFGTDADGSTSTFTAGQTKKRSRRDSDAPGLVGISGAAGRHLKRIKEQEQDAAAMKSKKKTRVFAGQEDFVMLEMPLSDSDADEDEGQDEEASSVDSDDLSSAEKEEEKEEASSEEEDEDEDEQLQAALLAPAATTALAAATTKAEVSSRPRATDILDEDALDYGDDDDE
ncbi:hypothetical protein JCM10908_004575 [Rhodotorula pacifica]|uniref:uncharacterized protein n=1 Tax=Rhodotorula pacifica TaxID=1495444 RepID=UPI00316BBE81